MKKLFFIFIFLGMGGLSSFLCGENFYFPECQVQISTPSGWYAHNATKLNAGVAFVSNEKITGFFFPSQAGLTFFYGKDRMMNVDVHSTNQFAAKIFPTIVEKYSGTVQKDIYELEGKLGKFQFLEIRPKDTFVPVSATGVLKTDKGTFIVVLKSPSQKWDSFKPILLEMVKNIRMYMTRRPDDIVVYSVNDDILSGVYKQRDSSQKEILLERFKKLKAGMTEAQYREIMKYKWKMYEGQKKGANFTPGLVKTIPVSVNGEDYVDIYGVYNRCISEELFHVLITGKKIDNLKLIERPLPNDFDIEEWENFLVGTKKNTIDMQKLFIKILKWATDPKRAPSAIKRLENVKIGMSEQEYLTISQSFMIHFSVLFTYRIIPGVFKINTSKDPKEGIKREYLYASREGEKFLPLKKVVVLDGKVASVTLAEKEELIKPTLTCVPSVVKPGGFILVDFIAPSDYPKSAWVGIIPSHVPHGLETENDRYDLSHKYLNKRARGTLFFTAPMKPGNYDFRMNNSDDGGKEVCSIPFTVKSPVTKEVTAKNEPAEKMQLKRLKIRPDKKARLIKNPDPEYPKEALEARIQGNVTINAATDIYGRVVRAEAVDGPEILRPAAVEAVKKWEYEPYILNGVPRPVKFTVVVKFNLNDKKKTDKKKH